MKRRKEDDIKLVIESNGDPSVGIFPYHEVVTVSFEYGGADPDIKRELVEHLRETFAGFFEGAKVHTEEEYKELMAKEKELWKCLVEKEI